MASWKNWLPAPGCCDWQLRPTPAGVETLRRQLLAVLDDCDGFECDRLRWRVHTAECAQELWLLRDAVFQTVASQHCQAAAAERINGLLPAFQHLLPSAPLHPV
jgi:hypothetical protein